MVPSAQTAQSPSAVQSQSGTCDGGTTVAFDPFRENQRPALALVNGTVYISWASHGDQGNYHGWLIGYNASTLARTVTWNAMPNKLGSINYCRGGIWMSG